MGHGSIPLKSSKTPAVVQINHKNKNGYKQNRCTKHHGENIKKCKKMKKKGNSNKNNHNNRR